MLGRKKEIWNKAQKTINKIVESHKPFDFKFGMVSDGYHTFDELYYHRMILFSVVCNQNAQSAWKSKLHSDGTMFDNYFIVGITTSMGEYTYHYPIEHWDLFYVNELDRAPEWDGHEPKDITRLLCL